MIVSRRTIGDFAKEFVKKLPHATSQHAHVVGLSGPLGAGKTTFVQSVARELGVAGTVPSPTFILMRSYPVSRGPFSTLIHIDAYRLAKSEKDTAGLGAYFNNPLNLILVEWPENLPGGLPEEVKRLEFKVAGEDEREITEW